MKDALINSTERREFEFYWSSITLQNVTFKKSFAYGIGASFGSGGALYASSSVMVIEDNSMFESNSASIGGAIATIRTSAYVADSVFASNKAFKWAGAFYAQSKVDKMQNNQLYVQSLTIVKSTFNNNSASSVGGAITVSSLSWFYLDSVNFSGQTSIISGGAVWIIDTESKFFNSVFENNRVTAITERTAFANTTGFGTRSRGGGAIVFATINSQETKSLVTQDCVICHNLEKTLNHEIILEGNNIVWTSVNDQFNESNVGKNDGPNIKLQIFNSSNTCECQSILETESVFSRAPTSRSASGATSYVPSPTEYTYVATPITRLPYQTTSSIISYSTAQNLSVNYQTKSVHHTFAASTPIETLADSPFESPNESPISSPFETINTSPNEPPIENISYTIEPSKVSPDKTPYQIVDESPKETLVLTPVKSIIPPTQSKMIISGRPYYPTIIVTSTFSSYFYTSLTLISISSISNGQTIVVESYVNSTFVSVIYVESTISTFQLAEEENQNSNEVEKSNTGLIVGAAVGCLITIIIIGVILYFYIFYKKKGEESSTISVIEMNEETVMIAVSSTSAITNDNPLWTSSVLGNDDDPFRNDFEEGYIVGSFPFLRDASDSEVRKTFDIPDLDEK